MSELQYEYVALIDESGDAGLRQVKPLDPGGSSEWLIISAVLFRRSNSPQALAWGRELMTATATQQTREFNFAKLRPHRQLRACEIVASKPVRIFTVASNKKNMRNYKNPFAESKSVTLVGRPPGTYEWFYYWISRVLLEKLSDWVYRHSVLEYGEPKRVKLVFSERQSMRYDELGFYYDLLRQHDLADTQHIKQPLRWEVLSSELLDAQPHNSRSDMNLPDVTASALFAAVAKHDRGRPVYLDPAKKLESRTAKRHKKRWAAGYGMKLMPRPDLALLDDDQAEIFKFYGYKKGW